MAVSPINLSRISHNLQTNFVLGSLQRTQRELYTTQARIASGRDFVSPSENPVGASRALDLTQARQRQDQFVANLRQGDGLLSAADSAFIDVNDLLIQASVIASQSLNSVVSADEREAEAEIVSRIRQQVQDVANRSLNGRHIFAGRSTMDNPFIDALGGVAYVGDTQALSIRANDGQIAGVSVTGDLLFGALSQPLSRDVDLAPSLAADVRLDDINGPGGRTIETGTLVFNEVTGAGTFRVDLGGAGTIGDIVDLVNAAATAAGATLQASLEDNSLVITPGSSDIAVTDTNAGSTTRSLGLTTAQPTSEPLSSVLTARLTRLTPVDRIAGGAGIDLDGGIVITNGQRSTVLDLGSAETVQDIINAINGADVFVLARISDDGTGIDVFNQVSGTSLSIGESAGTTAADLGIRTMNVATPLSQLNFGRGVGVADGKDDLQVITKDGSSVPVNLDGAQTIGDVIDLINDAATTEGVSVTASFADLDTGSLSGNGIRLEDGTGGTGDLTVSPLNLSTAVDDLGLRKTVTGDGAELVGDDVNPTRTEGIIGVLFDLENALRSDNTRGIADAGARLDGLRQETIRVQGIVGARSQSMKSRLSQMEDTAATTDRLLSEVQDLDFAEAATAMQAAMTQLQANLQVSSSLMNLSLLDFLR